MSALLPALLASLFMALIAPLSRQVTVGAEVVTFSRLFLGAMLILLFLVGKGKLNDLRFLPGRYIIFSGTALSLLVVFYVKAIDTTTMANAVFLLYMGPMIAAILAHFFLQEKIGRNSLIALTISFTGIMCLAEFRITYSAADLNGYIFGGLSGLMYALFIIFNRLVRTGRSVFSVSFYQMLAGALVVAPLALGDISVVSGNDLPWLFLIGIFPGFLAIICAVRALRSLSARLFGALMYLEPVEVSLSGWLFYQEALSTLQLLGGALVLCGGLIMLMERKSRPRKPDQQSNYASSN